MGRRWHPRELTPHLAPGCLVGAVVGGVAAMVALRQVLVYWADCDVGINAGASLWYLAIFVWPPLALLNGVLFTLVFAVARTRNTGGFAAGIALFALAVVTVVEMNVLIPILTPSGYPLTC